MVHVGPVILASAGTTILGLMMLMSADLVVIKNAGKVLGIVLSICLLAAMTLTPAMAYVMGNAFFWPGKPDASRTVGQRSIWPRVASDLVHRPTIVFLVGLIVIGIPAVSSFGMKLRYDSFGEVAKGTTAARGLDIVENHFSRDELFSSKILIESDDLASGAAKAEAVSTAIAERLSRIDDVTDVWHVGAPFGSRRSTGLATSLGLAISQSRVRDYYFATDKNILQLEVMQRHPPLGAQAAGVLAEVRAVVESWAHENLAKGYSIHAIGDTPYIESIKAAADRDLRVVVVWVVVVIFLTVLFFIRRFWLSVFMLIATLITYIAALGLTEWVFVGILGRPGVDYKIKIFVFVVIVAVGQDYNVFLVMRMLQELKSYSLNEAVTRAVVLTGPVISSCGLIMAAALGSLSTSGMDMTEQLGFAFAAGILLYTFVVRPLLIPSFYLIMERMRERSSSPTSASPPRAIPAPSE
jgi:RND superfamily putative drug exporter